MAKKALINWTGFTVNCPNCKEPIAEPKTGSFMWSVNEPLPEQVACDSCGWFSDFPKSVKAS